MMDIGVMEPQHQLLRSMTDTRYRSQEYKEFHPSALVDGSKIIFRLGKNDRIAFDYPTRLLFSTSKIKVETVRSLQSTVNCEDTHNLIVIDSGVIGERFFPISLAHYGTVYTRDGSVHAVLGDHRRHKVTARSLPYRTCNKFEQAAGEPPPTEEEREQPVAIEASNGMLYLRSDESMTRYRLCKGECIVLHSGQLVAWTLGVHFEYKTTFWCIRYVSAVSGEGTVWIQNPTKQRAQLFDKHAAPDVMM
eukprot:GHVN01064771.1.p1 GENE.GHVN01064771.1~~GHVN01064771.1.p1  ORF type:complete len:248 (+),score=49.92 GHVN01064771.1:186-929(+)